MSASTNWIAESVNEHYRELGLDVQQSPDPLQTQIAKLETRICYLEQRIAQAPTVELPVFDIDDLGEPLDADDPVALANYCGSEQDDGYGVAFADYVDIDYRAEIEKHLAKGPLTAAVLEGKISTDYPDTDEGELADGLEATLVDMGESGDLFDSYPNGGGLVMLADVPADIRDLRNLRHISNPPRKAELLWREMVKRKLRADRGYSAEVPASWERNHGLSVAAGV